MLVQNHKVSQIGFFIARANIYLERAPVEADDAMGSQSEEAVTLSWEEYQRMTNLFVMKIR